MRIGSAGSRKGSESRAMKLNRTYAKPADMPPRSRSFRWRGRSCCRAGRIQLTVFEPRYLAMLDDALSGERLIGIIQPVEPEDAAEPTPDLYPIGCAGRIVQYAEIGDGRCFLTLMGVARFRLAEEMHYATPYRVAARRLRALRRGLHGRRGRGGGRPRQRCSRRSRRFAEVNDVKVAWSDIKKASNEALVNGLSMMSPCGPREKQALLEAADLKSRAEMLVAITTIDLARGDNSSTQLH